MAVRDKIQAQGRAGGAVELEHFRNREAQPFDQRVTGAGFHHQTGHVVTFGDPLDRDAQGLADGAARAGETTETVITVTRMPDRNQVAFCFLFMISSSFCFW